MQEEQLPNDWNEYRRLILEELKQHGEQLSSIKKQLDEMNLKLNIDIASMKKELEVKSGLFGVIGGLIPVILFLIYELLKSKIN